MPAGRPTEGLKHIDRVDGSFEAKHRMKAIVLSMMGEATVSEACARLGIGASRFHIIRQQALQAAVKRLEPHAAGRPYAKRRPSDEQVRELEERLAQSASDLRRERIRAEIALAGSYGRPTRGRGGQSRSG